MGCDDGDDTTGTPDCRGPEHRDPGGWGIITFDSGVHAFIEASEALAGSVGIDIRVVGSLAEMQVGDTACTLHPWSGEAQQLAGPPSGVVTMQCAVDEIIAALDTGGPTTSTGEDGRATLEIITGFHVSDRHQAQQVALPLQGDDRDVEIRIG